MIAEKDAKPLKTRNWGCVLTVYGECFPQSNMKYNEGFCFHAFGGYVPVEQAHNLSAIVKQGSWYAKGYPSGTKVVQPFSNKI